jgi:hypothetical protein
MTGVYSIIALYIFVRFYSQNFLTRSTNYCDALVFHAESPSEGTALLHGKFTNNWLMPLTAPETHVRFSSPRAWCMKEHGEDS